MNNKVYRKILRMVSELHLRGFQKLRIAPGMAPSGMYWRCSITSVNNISNRNGAKLLTWEKLSAHYTSADERKYFGWENVAHVTPSRLADLFVKRFPKIVDSGEGSDWAYAGWFIEMLHLTYPNELPIAYADWSLPRDYLTTVGERDDVRIPLPPPGLGVDEDLNWY